MQGLDFKHGLRDELATLTEPPPMNETEMLDAAKKALRRRRAAWASAGSVAAVLVLATGMAFTATGDDRAGPVATTETDSPRHDRADNLLDDVIDAVPAGFETPSDLTYVGDPGVVGRSLREFQGVSTEAGPQSFRVTIPVTRDGRMGMLQIEVVLPGDERTDGREGCALAAVFWDLNGTGRSSCQPVTVAGTTVQVSTPVAENSSMFDQRAAYRHSDGIVVLVGQSPDFPGSGQPGMTQLPFTPGQLAELAIDPRFHLS